MNTKAALALTFLFWFLMGVGQLFLLPPFEGFDEIGHYSLIAQTAQDGSYPMPDKAFLAQEVEAYKKVAPMPYAVFARYDQNGGLTYPAFFQDAEHVDTYKTLYRTPQSAPLFTPSSTHNWEVQQPPFYYEMMAKVLRAVEPLSFVDRFFVLRLLSLLFACAGVVIALWGSLRYLPRPNSILLSFLLYPVILPQTIPEFARLGNDSLCLFIFGILWALWMRGLSKGFVWWSSLCVGLILAQGLLTKAFFIPISFGWVAFVCFRIWIGRHDSSVTKMWRDHLAYTLPALFLSGLWYFGQYYATGALLGHVEYKLLAEQGGIVAQWGKGITPASLLNGFFNLLFSWVWAGMASMVRMPEIVMVALLALPLWLLGRAIAGGKKHIVIPQVQLAVFLILPMLAGLAHHFLMILAIDPRGGTPAWYLHILMPAFALLFASALGDIMQRKVTRLLLIGLIAFAVLFMIASIWFNVALVGGCASFTSDKIFSFPDQAFCLTQINSVLDKAAVVVWPSLGLVLVIASMLVWLVVFRALWRISATQSEKL